MSLVALATTTPLPARLTRHLVDVAALQRELESQIEGEVRFDAVSRALYSTDASVYQIEPLGVVVAKTREDLIRIVRIATRFRLSHHHLRGGTLPRKPGRRSARAFKSTLRNTITRSWNSTWTNAGSVCSLASFWTS